MPIALSIVEGVRSIASPHFVFVLPGSCSFRILDHVFTDTRTRIRLASEIFLSSLQQSF